MQPKRLVIVGGGTAGWMAANLFAARWASAGVHITLVESPDVPTVGVGEGSTPTLKRFFQAIGVQESDWMPAANATYKVNIRFKDWAPDAGAVDYSHPFISQPDTFTQRDFLINARTRRMGLDTHTTPADFLLNGVLAKHGKGPITPDNFPFRIEYGYHFDAGLLAQHLRRTAIDRGVNHLTAHIDTVGQSDDGAITRLHTRDGQSIDGDFFIDCSGFKAMLMRETLGVAHKSFNANLFNDAAVVAATEALHPLPPETLSTALSAGWAWRIPLTNRTGNGYVYSSDFISREQAEQEFRQHLGLSEQQECRHLRMQVGQLEKHWHKNCLALGLSQGFIEPLEATALHLVQICTELFMDLFEKAGFSSQHAQEYNQRVSDRFERVRDYIVAHYKLNNRNDSDYWRACRAMTDLSPSLQGILDCWYKAGDLETEIQRQGIENHFGAVSWNCLLAGYGVFPKLAPTQPGTGDLYQEKRIAQFLEGCALNFSDHAHNLQLLHKK
ncbi:tryptophan halogenase family protein [Simiduia agarivorans]|uniref:Tryptophan halogenase n=1 Tax=Simiduia agarivorans (strain DSM 21679 / JCM 13881 / BCRC 17597 / SA1) TaxID=1117647 RepID=K4KM68_SIMAS|nr:tryptophan halogenase family protein [Simiduia agarivorans]AFU99325.2 tryptophan halogenase [Simiduia agarivorans SA1 = DSM 21679]